MENNSLAASDNKIKKKFLGAWFTKKKIIWTLVILLVVVPIAFKIFGPKNNAGNIQTDTVKKQNLKLTVLATGQVVSSTDLDLSFKASGVVSRINVKEGDKVKAGSILATLNQGDQAANLTSAQGALAQAKANYQKVIAGASSEDVNVAQVTLDNAKSALANTISQQQVLIDNAYKALLNSGLAAIASTGNTGSVTVTISGAYTGLDQGVYKIAVTPVGGGLHYSVTGLESYDGVLDTSPQPLGTKGLYIQFSSTSVAINNTWTVSIPNTQASTYVTNYSAYQSALQTQKSAVASAQNTVASAQAALDLKKAQARPADVAAAEAQIISAQGQVQAAYAAFDNTVIRAPAAGTITSVDVKTGELASALKEVIVLQDVGSLHAEADVSEANIATLEPNQSVDITFDALGPDRHFTGTIQTVNPGATVVSGVVDYKVKASLPSISEIKPGMTANMTILVSQKDNVLAVPSRAILSNGSKKVRVVDDSKKKTYHEVEVTTGLEADGGLTEITSGLSEGQEIVTFIKQ